MNRSTSRAASLALASILSTLAANVALAASTSPDLRAVCPGVDAALQDALSQAWSRYQLNGTVRVDMQLQGQRVVDVSTSSGPIDYRAAVRRAVRGLSCNGGDDDRHTISFNVRFTDETGTPAHS